MDSTHSIKPKIYIEYSIITNSDREKLIEEFKYLIGMEMFIIVWSKQVLLEEMLAYCTEQGLTDYIWDFKQKDSMLYGSVEFIIDNDQSLVDMFIRNGRKANYIERIE